MQSHLLRLFLALLLATATASAVAQFGGGTGGGRRGRGGDATSGSRTADQTVSPEARAQQLRDRLYDLRLGLRITPEQSAAWQAFSDRVWDLGGRSGFALAPSESVQGAPQLLAQRAAQAQQRAAQLHAVADAAAQLYELLSPDQRQTADHDLAAAVPPEPGAGLILRGMADADTPRPPRNAGRTRDGASALPLPGLDLNLLKAFSAVYHYRQVTAAGQHLGMTPSAVSNALARLRAHCGDPLFVRTQRGVVPTPFADRLWQSVSQGLGLLQQGLVRSNAFEPAGSDRMFRVNLADVGQMLMVGEVMRGIAAEAPGVGIRTVDLDVRDVEDSLVSGELDLAVGHLASMGKRLFRRKLVSERFVCMVSDRHPRYRGTLELEDFLAGTHIRYSPAVSLSRLNDAIERFFRRQHRPQHIVLQAAHAFGLSAIVAETGHILTVPARLAEHYARLAPLSIHPLPIKVPAFDISLYWHERDQRDPAHQWFRARFADAVRGASGSAET